MIGLSKNLETVTQKVNVYEGTLQEVVFHVQSYCPARLRYARMD